MLGNILVALVICSVAYGLPVQDESHHNERGKVFKPINLCKIYELRNKSRQAECELCFQRASANSSLQEDGFVSDESRKCIELLPPAFHSCSREELVIECLTAQVRKYFKHKFHRFWKKWRDLFDDTERGRIHQVFALKTLIRKMANESSNHLDLIMKAFAPCANQSANGSSDSSAGRTLPDGLDALDAAALEGSDDDESVREDRSDDVEEDETVDDREDAARQEIDNEDEAEKGSDFPPDDPAEEQEFERKKQRLRKYLDTAHASFICKIQKIKNSVELTLLVKQTLQTYEDVVPAELVRALYE